MNCEGGGGERGRVRRKKDGGRGEGKKKERKKNKNCFPSQKYLEFPHVDDALDALDVSHRSEEHELGDGAAAGGLV